MNALKIMLFSALMIELAGCSVEGFEVKWQIWALRGGGVYCFWGGLLFTGKGYGLCVCVCAF